MMHQLGLPWRAQGMMCVFQAVSFARFVAFSDLREGYMDQKRRSALEVRCSAVVLVSPESLKELPRILKLFGWGGLGRRCRCG